VVRDEAARLRLPAEREHLIRVGNELRAEHGAGVLAERILERLGPRDVVDSIRSPAEVRVLRRRADFVLVAVAAPVELRFRRSLGRGRAGDPVTLDDFLRREAEENTDAAHAQQLEATFRLADRTLDNDGDLDALRSKVDALVDELEAASRTA
jgi:dephospho-CoA kinase